METVLLYVFCVLALSSGVATVLLRHPIHAALGLLSCSLCLAAVYAMLGAHLVAAMQVVVQAGAIVILIVYVVMLIEGGTAGTHAVFRRGGLIALPVMALFAVLFLRALASVPDAGPAALAMGDAACPEGEPCELACSDAADGDGDGRIDCADPDCALHEACFGTVEAVGAALLGPWALPFEFSSLLLLAGIVGAVVLTRTRPDPGVGPTVAGSAGGGTSALPVASAEVAAHGGTPCP